MKQLIILIIISLGVVYFMDDQEYVEIPSSSIRMRVIGASNSEEDQSDKKKVKSFVEEKVYELIAGAKTSEEVDKIIGNNKEEIDRYIIEKMDEDEIDATFSSNFGFNYFPEKEFKGLVYKAGNYKSLVVTLGKGEGENWWCVMYPPLCLIDDKKSDMEYHSLIKDTILKYN